VGVAIKRVTMKKKFNIYRIRGRLSVICFLGAIYLTNGQAHSIEISVGPNFSKPVEKEDLKDNSFEIGIGWNSNISSVWGFKKHYTFRGGIIVNKLEFKEIIENLLFGSDIINNTRTTLERTVRFHEVGGICTVSRTLPRKLKNFSPILGFTFSKLLGKVSSGKKSGNGEAVELNNLEIPDYSFALLFGIKWETSLNKRNSFGISPFYSYRLSRIESSTVLPTAPFRPNTFSLQFSFKHSI